MERAGNYPETSGFAPGGVMMGEREHPELLLRNLPGAFFFVDRAGRITDCNPALLQMLSMEESELLGQPPEKLVDPEDLDSTLLAHPAGGSQNPFVRTALRHSNGERVPVLLGLNPIEHEGERYGVLAMALELGHLESSRPSPLFDPLDSLDRLKADFIAIASHELRTPLAIIKGYADAFLTGELGGLSEFQSSRMEIIDARVDQMTGIINDLLDLGRISEQRLVGERHKTSLSRLVESEVEALQMEAEAKQLNITCRIQDGLPGIIIDADRIRQALENVLDNAVKFTLEGGEITVSAALAPGGGALEVVVQDSGPGIPAGQLDQVFAMFYQVDATSTRRAGGLGLGLYIARGIAEAHGGDIRIESEVGRGSTCTLRLPFHPEGQPCD